MITHLKPILITIIFVGLLHPPALALNNEEVFSQFQFNFITPGARATAMGGAFIGLADDVTAAATNPAGLTVESIPEFTTECKYFGYRSEYIYEIRSFETDITRKEFADSAFSIPSFIGLVFPYKWFVFSFYFQEILHYKSSFRTSGEPFAIPGTDVEFRPIDASADLTVINYGIGAAVKLFEKLSLAVFPGWSEMKTRFHTTRYARVYGHYETTIDDDDSGLSLNTGLLWKPHPKFSVGVVYKSGTTFTVKEVGGFSFLNPEYDQYDPDLAEFTMNVPDSFGAGVSLQATDFLTFMFDVIHIQYKDLLKDFDVADFGVNPGDATKNNYTVDNTTEIHVGMEYILPIGKRLLALRAGAYNNPDHTIRYTGTSGDEETDRVQKILFPGGNDQIHLTGGLGLIFNEYFQIDAAANIADSNAQFSFSAVYRFGGAKGQTAKPLLTRPLSPKPVEKAPPSIRFTVMMAGGREGKTLEIRKITTDSHGIGNIKVTTKQVGTTEFLIIATLEREQKRFTADIRIDIGQNRMTIEEIDSLGQVRIMKEQPDSLEFMIKFM